MPSAFLVFAFFASGFAALIYQVAWQRVLTLVVGADVYSVTIIVAAFMAGMGFGHLAGGHVADRFHARGRILAFAACESMVAVFAVFSTAIYYDLLQTWAGSRIESRGAIATIAFLVTLWPTFFMGMSLPLIARIFAAVRPNPARSIALLYGWNTLGAASGSLATVLVLLRLFDLRTIVQIGAGLSLFCGVTALVLVRSLTRPETPAVRGTPPDRGARRGFGAWLGAYALSGFVALSLEIVWFRVLGVTLKSNAFTFGVLLAVYLTGLGLGSLVMLHPRLQRLDPRRGFFACQALVPIWAALSLALFAAAVNHVPWGDPIWRFLANPRPPGDEAFRSGRVFLLYATLAPAIVLPPTLLMGVSFGLLQRLVHDDERYVGRRLAWLQAMNIAGAMSGALVTGLWLLDWLGTSGTLRLLAASGALFALPLLIRPGKALGRRDRILGVSGVFAAVVVAVVVPSQTSFWSRLHGSSPEATTVVAEDRSGLVVIRKTPDELYRVFLSGFSQSWFPYGDIHTALGALPAMLHPHPTRVAVIGLGSGDTVFSVGGRPETERIDSIEIVASQLPALQRAAPLLQYAALEMLLTDPRVHYAFTDARAYLRRTIGRYDIIEADAMPPWSAYAGNLYSLEYFGLIREALRPGGLAAMWTPTERVRATLLRVFPHVLFFRTMAIASTGPVAFDWRTIEARLQNERSRRHYQDGGVDVLSALRKEIGAGPVVYGPTFDRSPLTDVNRDLFPQDEFGREYSSARPSLLAPVRPPSDTVQAP